MILTDIQKKILNFIDQTEISQKIYWSGGTALAYRYNHRLSSDLDFFSQELLADFEILPFIKLLKKKFKITNIENQIILNRNIFILQNEKIKPFLINEINHKQIKDFFEGMI